MQWFSLDAGGWIRFDGCAVNDRAVFVASERDDSPARDSFGDPIGCCWCAMEARHSEAEHGERIESEARRWHDEESIGWRVLSDRVVTVRGVYRCAHCMMEHAHGDHMRIVTTATEGDGIHTERTCAYGCRSHGRAA